MRGSRKRHMFKYMGFSRGIKSQEYTSRVEMLVIFKIENAPIIILFYIFKLTNGSHKEILKVSV